MSLHQDPQVIVVGGGPVGLSCSILLSLRNIPHLLFEKHPGTAIHPKCVGINQRTMEIFRQVNVEAEIIRQAGPHPMAVRTGWYTGLGKDGREIITRDTWGGGQYAEEYESYSPSMYRILPQIRMEPILRDRAMELNPKGVIFSAEVLDVWNEKDHAGVKVGFRDTGKKQDFQCRYVLCADGGRKFTDHLGVKWTGQPNLFSMITGHLRGPLLKYHPDDIFLTWLVNPKMGGSTKGGFLYQIGPFPITDPNEEEWVFTFAVIDGKDPKSFDKKALLDRLQATVGIPELPMEVLSASPWKLEAINAEKYRVGRIFLLGDAAHKIPPWGALGMNTGVQDAQNLIWKLELALKDEKYEQLLDTYDTERRDIGKHVGEISLYNMMTHSNHMDAAIGISATQTSEENVAAAQAFFDPANPDGEQKRKAVKKACDVLDIEFHAPGLEAGWFYPSADIDNEGGPDHDGQLLLDGSVKQLPDGSLNPDVVVPTTIPGHNLPHVWLEKEATRVAIRDLLQLSKLVLFTDAPVPACDERVLNVVVGPTGWQDTSGRWKTLLLGKAVLVRSDGIVAWRGRMNDTTSPSLTKLVDRVLRC